MLESLYPFIYLTLLSLIQGVAEFLPISSSGHLLILPNILNVADQGIIVDISAHIGSLLAVLYFYRKEIYEIILSILRVKKNEEDDKLFMNLLLSLFPIIIIGGIIYLTGLDNFRNPNIVIYTSIIFGILLYISDKYSKKQKELKQLSYKDSLIIGLSQTLALIPGVSRSGITITTGMGLGQTRSSIVKYTFLLSIPTIMMAGCAGVLEFINSPVKININYLLFTIMLSFIFSLTAIKFMIGWVRKSSFKIFAIYRILFEIFLYFFLNK